MDSSEFRRDVWLQNTIPAVSYGAITDILRLAILVPYQHVTDGQTNRQTEVYTTTAYTKIA